jgi:UDP-GlcNAc3NAcA epimerase|uniref:non-hydrolyzing UDP-N-acetylglucosamine 2-epimerase n=1 Tax=Algoriphagus sp. TaxID=1872435 RepID=UPI0040470F9A
MKKIACIVGARPQFIKHFPLEIELAKSFEVVTIHTGQHFDENMSNIFFDELGIKKPNFHFQLSKSSHAGQTAEMLESIEKILIEEQIDLMLVYGDTNSTIAGALAASKLNIPIIHVEAGLRSYNRNMPEEVNRVLTDHISSHMFCSSEVGVINLKNEGIDQGVFVCGDLMKDALFMLKDRLTNPKNYPFILATLHRPYNTDDTDRLKNILLTLNSLDKKVIFPIHPRTKKVLENENFDFSVVSNIEFIKPVGYIEMLSLLKFCDLMITDSGGVQKEAYWMCKQCITVRSETEWIETLEGGWNTLIFHDLERIIGLPSPDNSKYNPALYGTGNSASLIVEKMKMSYS